MFVIVILHFELSFQKRITLYEIYHFIFRVYAFPEYFRVRPAPFVIHRERHGIVGIYNAVMFYQVSTGILANIIYPSSG